MAQDFTQPECQTCIMCTTSPSFPHAVSTRPVFMQHCEASTAVLLCCHIAGVQEAAYPPHAMTTVSPMIANDSQYEGKVSTLSGVAAELVCNAAHTAQPSDTTGAPTRGQCEWWHHYTPPYHTVQITRNLETTACLHSLKTTSCHHTCQLPSSPHCCCVPAAGQRGWRMRSARPPGACTQTGPARPPWRQATCRDSRHVSGTDTLIAAGATRLKCGTPNGLKQLFTRQTTVCYGQVHFLPSP